MTYEINRIFDLFFALREACWYIRIFWGLQANGAENYEQTNIHGTTTVLFPFFIPLLVTLPVHTSYNRACLKLRIMLFTTESLRLFFKVVKPKFLNFKVIILLNSIGIKNNITAINLPKNVQWWKYTTRNLYH